MTPDEQREIMRGFEAQERFLLRAINGAYGPRCKDAHEIRKMLRVMAAAQEGA